jgi:transposase, IS605 family
MQILKAFKFELIPNSAQVHKMKQFCGCTRFVFNRALTYQNEKYKADKSFKFSYKKITNLLPAWKQELPWLKDCHSQVLQQSLKDLEAGFKNFFAKRSNFPKFKRKGEIFDFRKDVN